MRVNVYGEELTEATELVSKVIKEGPAAGKTFYGIRLYLVSPDALHDSEDDDDRSAVTLWCPWTAKTGNRIGKMRRIIRALDRAVQEMELAVLNDVARASNEVQNAKSPLVEAGGPFGVIDAEVIIEPEVIEPEVIDAEEVGE